MPRMIINVYRGIVEGVYTDIPDNLTVEICDSDDKYDDERSGRFSALQHQIKYGGLLDIMEDDIPEIGDYLPVFNPQALMLIRDLNLSKTDEGRNAQYISAAFVDGYLAANAELSRFIRKLFKCKHPDAQVIYQALAPLIDHQNSNYDRLYKDLNMTELYEESSVNDLTTADSND